MEFCNSPLKSSQHCRNEGLLSDIFGSVDGPSVHPLIFALVVVNMIQKPLIPTAWKVSKYGVISGPYFPVFGLNTERFLWISVFSPSTGKYGREITPYLDTFHTVPVLSLRFCVLLMHLTKSKHSFLKFFRCPVVNISLTKTCSVLTLLVVCLLTKYAKQTLSSQTFDCVYFNATQNKDIHLWKVQPYVFNIAQKQTLNFEILGFMVLKRVMKKANIMF